MTLFYGKVRAYGVTGYNIAQSDNYPSFSLSEGDILKLLDKGIIEIAAYHDFFDRESRNKKAETRGLNFLRWNPDLDPRIEILARTKGMLVDGTIRNQFKERAAEIVKRPALKHFIERTHGYGLNGLLIDELNAPDDELLQREEYISARDKYDIKPDQYRGWKLVYNLIGDRYLCKYAEDTSMTLDRKLRDAIREVSLEVGSELDMPRFVQEHKAAPNDELIVKLVEQFGSKVKLDYQDIMDFRGKYKDNYLAWVDSVHLRAIKADEEPLVIAEQDLSKWCGQIKASRDRLKLLLYIFKVGHLIGLAFKPEIMADGMLKRDPLIGNHRWLAWFVSKEMVTK